MQEGEVSEVQKPIHLGVGWLDPHCISLTVCLLGAVASQAIASPHSIRTPWLSHMQACMHTHMHVQYAS